MTASSPAVAYLDSSALVKLIAIEPGDRGAASRAAELAGLRLLAIDPVAPAAATIGGGSLRSLDAIHLATAVGVAHEIGVVITYDHRMLTEARALDLPAIAPS